MMDSLSTVTIILATLAFLLPEQGRSIITVEDHKTYCPRVQTLECKPGMRNSIKYMNIYSHLLRIKYLCDTRTDRGGWIVILRRVHRDTKFNQLWAQYKYGFGTSCTDYWLGNKYIHLITNSGKFDMRVDMAYHSKQYYVLYRDFRIGDEQSGYRLQYSTSTGNTVDDLSYVKNMKFSTPDRDNDVKSNGHCAEDYSSGWWFKDCHGSLLTGDFERENQYAKGVIWPAITTHYKNLDMVEMKIRRQSH